MAQSAAMPLQRLSRRRLLFGRYAAWLCVASTPILLQAFFGSWSVDGFVRHAGSQTLSARTVRRPAARVLRWASGGDDASDEGEVETVDSIRYLPPLDFSQREALEPEEGTLVLPCFPLGETSYLPDTDHVLNIFEPRYRQMYSDILMSGGRRFVVPYSKQEEGTGKLKFAEVGVVFYLKDLKEVSEQTQDQVKYVCEHSVIGRVRLKRVLNPRDFADASTYLRVEVEDFTDADLDMDHSLLEQLVKTMVSDVARLQNESSFEVQFREDLMDTLNATRGPGFWGLVSLWQSYLTQRAQLLQNKFQKELQAKLISFFKETDQEIPSQVSLDKLPAGIQKDVVNMQVQLREDIRPLVEEQSQRVQEMVQTQSHQKRLMMLEEIIEKEQNRLRARLSLKSLFNE